MIRQFIFFLLIIPISVYSQVDKDKLKTAINEELSEVNLDSVAHSLGYKKGDLVRVSIMFTITESGEIENIVARGPHKAFEDEAIKLLERLPKMDPAVVNGEAVSVRFAQPINFKITSRPSKKKNRGARN